MTDPQSELTLEVPRQRQRKTNPIDIPLSVDSLPSRSQHNGLGGITARRTDNAIDILPAMPDPGGCIFVILSRDFQPSSSEDRLDLIRDPSTNPSARTPLCEWLHLLQIPNLPSSFTQTQNPL